MERSRETEIQNETISESATASVPEDETGAAQSGCKPKSEKLLSGLHANPLKRKLKLLMTTKMMEMVFSSRYPTRTELGKNLTSISFSRSIYLFFCRKNFCQLILFVFSRKAESVKPDLRRFLKLAKKSF
jgi:hypothetical protein